MSHADEVPNAPDAGLLPELRSGSPTEPDAVPSVRATKRRVRKEAVAPATGREDIEAAVAASGLTMGQRVTMEGEIIYLSADSTGRVWASVRTGERGLCFDCWAADLP